MQYSRIFNKSACTCTGTFCCCWSIMMYKWRIYFYRGARDNTFDSVRWRWRISNLSKNQNPLWRGGSVVIICCHDTRATIFSLELSIELGRRMVCHFVVCVFVIQLFSWLIDVNFSFKSIILWCNIHFFFHSKDIIVNFKYNFKYYNWNEIKKMVIRIWVLCH